jgi:protein involved in polysaccharide export with SLBB domain
MKTGFQTSLLAVVLALAAVMPISAQAGSSPVSEPASLQPGDAVLIEVWRQPELSGEFRITTTGVIAHPMYRDVSVVDVPVDDVEALIERFLKRFETEPRFVAQPLFRIALGGEVRRPDIYYLAPGTTVAEAIRDAGGVSDRGDQRRVVVRRDGRDRSLNLSDPAGEPMAATVRSGDHIIVQRRRDILREYVAPVASVTSAVLGIARLYLLLN